MQSEELLNGAVRLFNGDSRDVLKGLPDNSVDSCVTDPPYALVSIVKRFGKENPEDVERNFVQRKTDGQGCSPYERAARGFMGQQWDTGETAFAVEFWAEVMRVLKPGGHVIAFSGTRTYHRLAVAIEDAGFEIRDMLQWLYGSGFPKSHDAAQSIEKLLTTGKARREDRDLGGLPRNRFSGSEEGGLIADTGGKVPLTTLDAAAWQGWGTALKPACEPMVMARKPLIGTVAANVLAHGTGAINVDACRVNAPEGLAGGGTNSAAGAGWGMKPSRSEAHTLGRWPANVLHDGSPEVVAGFPNVNTGKGGGDATARRVGTSTDIHGTRSTIAFGDSGSAARFFYSAKADAMDRIGSKHPTVKPVDLMQWLCRLVTPPGGVILDPFAGSGSTGEAAFREGFKCILVEREADYCVDIRERMAMATAGDKSKRRAIAKRKGGDAIEGGLFA